MRLTIEEASRQLESFQEFLFELLDEDVSIRRSPDGFTVTVLRQKKRLHGHIPTPPPAPER